jgi:hypothetical protein
MLEARMLRLVEERQIHLLQVDEIDRELPVGPGAFDEPFSDGTARPPLPSAGDDDVKLHPSLWTGSDDNQAHTREDSACRDGWTANGR